MKNVLKRIDLFCVITYSIITVIATDVIMIDDTRLVGPRSFYFMLDIHFLPNHCSHMSQQLTIIGLLFLNIVLKLSCNVFGSLRWLIISVTYTVDSDCLH